MKAPTINEILPYVDKGLVTMGQHFQDPDLCIFNYTPECQFGRHWDAVTLQCRGLILRKSTGSVVARPFSKFFNYDEYVNTGGVIPVDSDFKIAEKLDGSLGILYHIDGVPYIATRGSFSSDQAIWATDWWRKNVYEKIDSVDESVTYLFEIIYPENRIVVKYDFEGLVHIDTIDRETGQSVNGLLPYESIRRVNILTNRSIEWLMKHEQDNFEGYVVHYEKTGLRLKIKLDTYVKLHKVMTGLSERGVWELLVKKGIRSTPESLIEDVPDEFYEWIEFLISSMREEYERIEVQSKLQFESIRDSMYMKEESGETVERKDWAVEIVQMDNPPIGFAMLDGKDYSHIIFKMIKPSTSKTFRNDI